MSRIEITLHRDNGTAKSFTWPKEFVEQLSTIEIIDYAKHDVIELVNDMLNKQASS